MKRPFPELRPFRRRNWPENSLYSKLEMVRDSEEAKWLPSDFIYLRAAVAAVGERMVSGWTGSERGARLWMEPPQKPDFESPRTAQTQQRKCTTLMGGREMSV